MKRYALIATLLAAPASAQDRMSDAQCADSWAMVQSMADMPENDASVMTTDDGWCLIENSRFGMDAYSQWRIRSLRWRASDIDRFTTDGLPPRTLEVIAEGFGIAAQTGDPVLDYLFGLQTEHSPTGFGFSVRWDGVQNALIVEDAYFDFFEGNRIEATARIDGVDLTDWATVQMTSGSMGLTELSVMAEFDGWFEAFVAQSLGNAVLERSDVTPEAQVAALKEQAVEVIDMVPDAIMPTTSREALSDFVNSLPHPRGTAQLQLSADPGLGAARAAPLMLMGQTPSTQDFIDIGLVGVSVLFTWSPKGDAL